MSHIMILMIHKRMEWLLALVSHPSISLICMVVDLIDDNLQSYIGGRLTWQQDTFMELADDDYSSSALEFMANYSLGDVIPYFFDGVTDAGKRRTAALFTFLVRN
jgi:hypothetical protein